MNPCRLWLSSVVAVLSFSAAVDAGDSLAEKLPPGAIVSGELTNAASLLDRIRGSELLTTVVDSEPYKKWANSGDGRKFRGGRALLEGQLGMNLWDAVTRVFGERAIVALYPPAGGKQPDGVLLIHLSDDEVPKLIREKVEPWIEIADGTILDSEADGRWLLETNDGKAFGGLQERWLVLASSKALRDDTLALIAGGGAESLAKSPAWQGQALSDQSRGITSLAVVFDLDPVRQATGQDRFIPAKADNPLASLLFGGYSEVAANSSSIQGELTIDDAGFSLQVRTPLGREAVDAAHQTLLASAGAEPLTPNVPRQVGGFTLCRNWAEWYRQRDNLLEERVLPEYDKFETGLGNFLPGKDFAEDVLALLNTTMSFVAAGQTYPHLDGKPGMQLPAFGVVLDLQDPQRGADVFQLFFQTLGTIVNIEAGKGGRQPWVMSSESHDGVQVNFAKYLDRPQGSELPMVFNFQPAAGLVGNRYVAATSLELCRDLIDAVKGSSATSIAPAASGRNLEFSIDPVVGASLLDANRAIITAKGVQDGKSLDQASQELDALLSLLQRMTPVTLTADVADDQVELKLQGGWK